MVIQVLKMTVFTRSTLRTVTTTVFVHTTISGEQNHADQPKDQHLYEFYLIVCKQWIYPVLMGVHIQGRSCPDDLKKNAQWTVGFFMSGIDLTEVKSGFPALGMSCRPTWWCSVASPVALVVSPGIHRATIWWPVTCGHCDDRHSSSAVMFAA